MRCSGAFRNLSDAGVTFPVDPVIVRAGSRHLICAASVGSAPIRSQKHNVVDLVVAYVCAGNVRSRCTSRYIRIDDKDDGSVSHVIDRVVGDTRVDGIGVTIADVDACSLFSKSF